MSDKLPPVSATSFRNEAFELGVEKPVVRSVWTDGAKSDPKGEGPFTWGLTFQRMIHEEGRIQGRGDFVLSLLFVVPLR